MQRRDFITLLGGSAAAWPLAPQAQQRERIRRIGVLSTGDDVEAHTRFAAFAQALEQLGDGRNLRIDTRYATADNIHKH
jgi:putative ABC transport system substrate-binding protein